MEEHLADSLLKTADVLRWLGKHREANACTLLSRLVRARGASTLDGLELLVRAAEAETP